MRINTMLLPTRLAPIAGTVVDSEGHPLSGGFVSLMRRGATMMAGGFNGGDR